jgi:hypothetical protein
MVTGTALSVDETAMAVPDRYVTVTTAFRRLASVTPLQATAPQLVIRTFRE